MAVINETELSDDISYWEDEDGILCIENVKEYDQSVYLTLQELANIPQVRMLIEALEKAKEQIRYDNESDAEYRAIDASLGVSEWESFMPTVWNDIDNALAPFRKDTQ
jgi:hypothetical protein